MPRERKNLDEQDIVEKVRMFLINKERGNWHEDKSFSFSNFYIKT